MEFRLTYEGQLHANAAPKEKHEIRRNFHKQLATLWRTNPQLREWSEAVEIWQLPEGAPVGTAFPQMTRLGMFSRQWSRFTPTYNFVPLIMERLKLECELDIIFLRREPPGQLITPGGDIDNRMKTLLDALRMPKHQAEVSGPPADGEDPFFVLLEDDALVIRLAVTTDTLLTPPGNHPNDVQLVIGVRLKVLDVSVQNVGFL